MKILLRYPLTSMLSLLIIVLSLIPTKSFPQTDFRMADKFAHLAMYFMLACILWWEHWRCVRSKPTKTFIACSVLLPATLGVLMELAQAYFTTYRGGDWIDAVANTVGAVLALPIGIFLTRKDY